MAFAWLSDKTQIRSPYIAIQAVIGIVGLALMAYAPQNGVRYFGVWLPPSSIQSVCFLKKMSNKARSSSMQVVQAASRVFWHTWVPRMYDNCLCELMFLPFL